MSTVLLGLVIPAFGLLSVVLGAYMARAAQREKTAREELVARVDKAEGRLDASLKRERLRDNYIHQLRGAIVNSGGTPPEWPDGLTT